VRSATLFFILFTGPAQARGGHVALNSCVFTIGSFCPIESVGMSVAATVVLALIFGGLGFVWRGMSGESTIEKSSR